MSDQNGRMYGLTVLSPILYDRHDRISHSMALRAYLAALPNNTKSPFASVFGTHFARLVVMDDVTCVGAPARTEHLKSPYLIFTSDFDGNLDDYLRELAMKNPLMVNDIWKHCAGYGRSRSPEEFLTYIKKCQVKTTFYFADVNDKKLDETLRALRVKLEVAKFMETNQGKSPADIQRAFQLFLTQMENLPTPSRGAISI
jgi:hypothetical protein